MHTAHFCPLASGSKGNAILLSVGKTRILIDAGISLKALKNHLTALDIPLESIDAIMISHEHHDHISGLKMLALKQEIPVITNYETAKAIAASLQDCPKFKLFTTGETFEFQDLEITPFSVKHDAVDPVGFSILTEKQKIGIATDIGKVTKQVSHLLKECHILYVEANHDPQLLQQSKRPEMHKERVRGSLGHLSNEECATLIEEVYHANLHSIFLAHLSGECNTHEIALQTVQNALNHLEKPPSVEIAFQDRMSKSVIL